MLRSTVLALSLLSVSMAPAWGTPGTDWKKFETRIDLANNDGKFNHEDRSKLKVFAAVDAVRCAAGEIPEFDGRFQEAKARAFAIAMCEVSRLGDSQ